MFNYGIIVAVLFIVITIPIFAQESELSIFTSKDTYYYGDTLTFTVKVSKVTEDIATLYIIDEQGKSSSPIPMGIQQIETTITSPFPFESQTYPTGQYTLKIEYANESAQTKFFLEDSGRIVIPLWIKDVGRLWTSGAISDETFATAIEFLIKNNIIEIPETQSQQNNEKVAIPLWVKTNAEWWTQGLITDDDFAKGLQFLIEIGVIVV